MNRRSLLSGLTLGAVASCAPAVAPASPTRLPLTSDWKSARWIILPDLIAGQTGRTQHDNCFTIHHQFMVRTTPDNPFGYEGYAHVNSRTYRDWLAEGGYWVPEGQEGIPPHIQFGGAVVCGPRDPTFKQRWIDYARVEFA